MTLDIHGVLEFVDEGNFRIHDALSEDATLIKELNKNISWLIPQWFTGGKTKKGQRDAILNFEAVCNLGWGALYKHPELQLKLLAAAGTGKTVSHKFYRPSGKRLSPLDAVKDLLALDSPDIRDIEVVTWCRDSTKKDVDELLYRHGVPLDDHAAVHKVAKKARA